MDHKKIKTIDEYIASFPKDIVVKLEVVRKTIKKLAPKTEEATSYGIPTFKLNGNLIHFAALKSYTGLYPSPSKVQVFKKELTKYKTSKGAIQFPLDAPLPIPLIQKITKFCVKRNLAKKK